MSTSAPNALDVRPLPRERTRATLLATFDRLETGESFVLVIGEDPTDLCTCLTAERPGEARWTYLDDGPFVWQVQIERTHSTS